MMAIVTGLPALSLWTMAMFNNEDIDSKDNTYNTSKTIQEKWL